MQVKDPIEQYRTIVIWLLFVKILVGIYFSSNIFSEWLDWIRAVFSPAFLFSYALILPPAFALFYIWRRKIIGYYILLLSIVFDNYLIRGVILLLIERKYDFSTVFELSFYAIYYITIIFVSITNIRQQFEEKKRY